MKRKSTFSNLINLTLTKIGLSFSSDLKTNSMSSFLFKLIPCARRGKVQISEKYNKSPQTRVRRRQSTEPIEYATKEVHMQQTPIIGRARGFETVEMGTINVGNDNNADIKTTK